MVTSEIIKKAVEHATSIFEKATQMQFFLHFLCFALWLELGLFLSAKKLLLGLSWDDVEQVSPGCVVFLVVGYLFVMGYILRLLYAVVSWAVFWLSNQFSFPGSPKWGDIRGMVNAKDVLERTYKSKDYEPLRLLEAHRENCKTERKEMAELAYAAFAVLVLALCNHFFVGGAFEDEVMDIVASKVGTGLMQGIVTVLSRFLCSYQCG